ncbi:MAG TPA: hypothetical protein VGD01_10030 [Candidatus Elarobacter sp.]|jgi:hypothetical protein
MTTGKSVLAIGGALFALLVLSFLVVAGRFSAPHSNVAPVHQAPVADVPNGLALLYVPGPFRSDYEIGAEMRLPPTARNRSWYTVWLMLVAWPVPHEHEPFVQGGLMRWEQNSFALTAFTADEFRGVPLRYADRGDLAGGWHHVVLRGDATFVELLVDGRHVHRWDRARTFGKRPVYVQIGAELHRPGDSLEGTIRSITVKRDGDRRPHAEPIVCEHRDRGLRFRQTSPGVFEAAGTFAVEAPGRFIGCRNFANRR